MADTPKANTAPAVPQTPKVDPLEVFVKEVERITGVRMKDTRAALGMK